MWPTIRATPMPAVRRAARAVVVAALPVGIGGDGVARDRVPGDALRLQRVGAGDRNDRVDLVAGTCTAHSSACMPPSEPPATAASARDAELAAGARAATRTMSATVITGKSDPYGRPVAGLVDDGPVVPRQPPSRFVLTTKKLVGVEGLAGTDHAVPPAEAAARLPASRSSARKPSRVLSATGAVAKPAACASPLSAWQTRMTLSRAGDSVP